MTLGKWTARSLATSILALAAGTASAASVSIGYTDFALGTSAGSITKPGLVLNWTSVPGVLTSKGSAPWQGVGISGGRTNDEIDVQEFLNFGGKMWFSLDEFVVGYLFDGPEFGDVQEIARVSGVTSTGASVFGTLVNTRVGGEPGSPTTAQDVAVWTFGATSFAAGNLSPSAQAGGQAVWSVANPFAGLLFQSLSFTAVDGNCTGVTGDVGSCNNQSDFTFVSMKSTPVPEPATLALLGLGLLGAGVAARRRAR